MNTINFEFKIGEEVFDDLTSSIVKIIGISYSDGYIHGKSQNSSHATGYWVENDYLGGGRHPWELSKR